MFTKAAQFLFLSALVGTTEAFSGSRLAASRTAMSSRVVVNTPSRSFRLYQASPEEEEMMSEETKAQHEMASLDLSKTIYTSSMKSPKDSYVAFAEKGAANAKMAKRKIFHQSVLGGCYVGFGALLSLSVAGEFQSMHSIHARDSTHHALYQLPSHFVVGLLPTSS